MTIYHDDHHLNTIFTLLIPHMRWHNVLKKPIVPQESVRSQHTSLMILLALKEATQRRRIGVAIINTRS